MAVQTLSTPVRFHCPHCGHEVRRYKRNTVKGYFATCKDCDEDFYLFELTQTNKTKNGKI